MGSPILQEIRRTQNQHQVEHCVFGSHTFVPISWMCKKQTSVSHSSTESEIIYLDAGLRLDGIPALDLWDLIVFVLGNTSQNHDRTVKPVVCRDKIHVHQQSRRMFNVLNNVYLFPQTSNFRIKKLRCMCLRTTKQWLRWLSKEGVPQWDMFPGPTELRLIGYSIESIWTPKSKSDTSTPKTNLPTSWPKGTSHVTNGNHLLSFVQH